MRTAVRTYVLGFEEVITMKVYSARCPDCGFMNRGLYLEETDGWFECEFCGSLQYAGSGVEVYVESEGTTPESSAGRAAPHRRTASAVSTGYTASANAAG